VGSIPTSSIFLRFFAKSFGSSALSIDCSIYRDVKMMYFGRVNDGMHRTNKKNNPKLCLAFEDILLLIVIESLAGQGQQQILA
jgi:hypothetical protein